MTPLECPWAGSKDMGIALREAKRRALGHGRSGTQALVLALVRLAQSDESDLYPPRK